VSATIQLLAIISPADHRSRLVTLVHDLALDSGKTVHIAGILRCQHVHPGLVYFADPDDQAFIDDVLAGRGIRPE